MNAFNFYSKWIFNPQHWYQVEEETKKEVSKKYSKSDLRGLKVEHSAERFREGQEVILTLKDSGLFISFYAF